MIKLRAFWESLFVSIIFAVLVFFAYKYNLFWKYKWLDIPAHFLGGLWIGLTSLWIFCYFDRINSIKNYKLKSFLIVLSAVLIITIFWKLFELTTGISSIHNKSYFTNSLYDTLNGLIGGIVAYLYFIKRKKCN